MRHRHLEAVDDPAIIGALAETAVRGARHSAANTRNRASEALAATAEAASAPEPMTR